MGRSRLLTTCSAALLLSVGVVGLLRGDEITSTAKPAPLARFPSNVLNVLRQPDGSAVCATSEGVFLAVDDLHRWSAVPSLARNHPFRPVGGDRTRFFVEDLLGDSERQFGKDSHLVVLGDDYSLLAVEVNGKATVVRRNIRQGSVAAFVSSKVGAIASSTDVPGPTGGVAAVQNSLLLTTDGGTTWKAISLPLTEKAYERICGMRWTTPSRLLIAGTNGSLRLFEYDGEEAIRQIWTVTIPEAASNLVVDGDYVWAGDRSLHCLGLADGHIDATIKPGVMAEGMTVCHGSVLVWDVGSEGAPRVFSGLEGFKTLEELMANEAKVTAKKLPHIHIWARDAKADYVRRAKIPAMHIAGILPLEPPLCLIIASEGGGALLLDLDKQTLSQWPIQVTPLPPPPADPNVATSDELKAMLDLAARVPWRDRTAIFRESTAKMKEGRMTPRQYNGWLIEHFRHYIETKKPAPVDLAKELAEQEENSATSGQRRIEFLLHSQLPAAEAGALVAQSGKMGLTDRQRCKWLIEKYKEYLERHKPTPEEKEQPKEQRGKDKEADDMGRTNGEAAWTRVHPPQSRPTTKTPDNR